MTPSRSFYRKGFTLIELLVVIAVIGILAVVVLLVLNPAELLKQARDANRLSDLSTLNSAIGLYATDQSGVSTFSLGSSTVAYISVPDASSTCGSLGLFSLSGASYTCASTTVSRMVSGTGWIPIKLTAISSGAPISNLLVDPANQTSSNLYYSYATNGTQYELNAVLESQKYKKQFGATPILPGFPEVVAGGPLLTISPIFNPAGLVGYWSFEEGSGTVAYDGSGNGNNGALGAGITYAGGKVGRYALNFPGGVNVNVGSPSSLQLLGSPFSLSMWVALGQYASGTSRVPFFYGGPGGGDTLIGDYDATDIVYQSKAGTQLTAAFQPALGQWTMVTVVASTTGTGIYVNGLLVASNTGSWVPSSSTLPMLIGGVGQGGWLAGYIGSMDEVRLYNRVLSPAEIYALYNAQL